MLRRPGSLIVVFFWVLVGCEGPFIGDRAVNVEILNGPEPMKICSVGGVELLCVLNVNNFKYQPKSGSLQFYSLADPSQPVKAASPKSLEVPANAGDFEVVDVSGNDVLFILDRNENDLLVYDLSGVSFSARKVDGVAVRVDLPSNPQGLLSFQRSSDSKTFLAVTCMEGATLVFVDPTDLTVFKPDSSATGADVQTFTNGASGAKFFMSPRKTYDDPEKPGQKLVDQLAISNAQRSGYGVSRSVFLGGAHDLIVTPNFLASAVHSFRFSSFQNMANLAWDLWRWRDGYTFENGSVIVGSGDSGMRGIDVDTDTPANVYVSNSTDNQIYKIPATEFEESETDDAGVIRNTKGFKANSRDFLLETFPGSKEGLDFDSDTTDSVVPLLGDVLADKTGAGLDAQVLWVAGVEGNRIYRIQVPVSPDSGNPVTISHRVSLDQTPSRLLGFPAAGPYQFVYVTSRGGDVISVLNANDLTVAGELKN